MGLIDKMSNLESLATAFIIMIGLIAILVTVVIIALISINMGVIGSFQNPEKSAIISSFTGC